MKSLQNEGLISEKDFLSRLGENTGDFFKLVNLAAGTPVNQWTKRFYSMLSEKAHALESYLDDFHARYNKTFSYLTEVCALIKWFGNSGYLQKHILTRFPRYTLDLESDLRKEFEEESARNLNYINRTLLALLDEFRRLTKAIGLAASDLKSEELAVEAASERRILPQNIDEEESVEQRHIIAELATLYRQVVESLRRIDFDKNLEFESIKNQTYFEFEETKSRHYESMIHNIQSKYDTYIKNTSLEAKNPTIPFLRGHASISLHLFEMATIFAHIYERHENDIRYERTKEKTSEIVPKTDLLKALNGYVCHFGIQLFLEGEKHAEDIIKNFIEIQTIEIETANRFAIHARPLSLIAKVALHYNTPLEIEIEGQCCNAASIMQMILLAGNNPKPHRITFRGEERALRDIQDLFDRNLLTSEDLSAVPRHLRYLFH